MKIIVAIYKKYGMNKFIIFLAITLFSEKIFSQKLQTPKINFGVAFRFEPWVLEEKYVRAQVYGNYYPFLDNKTRFQLGISEKIPGKNNLSIALSNYLNYTSIGFKTTSLGAFINDKRIKRDHFIDVTNSFNSKKNRPHFVLGLGAGLMNCGTKFNYIKRGLNSQGQGYVIDSNAKASQRFFAPRLVIGAQKEGLNTSVIFHGTPDREGDQYPTIWMEIRIAFTLNPFVKRKKI